MYRKFQKLDLIATDPVEYVHQFDNLEDQEISAVLASQLAYGNAKAIRSSIKKLFDRLQVGDSVHFRSHFNKPKETERLLKDFRHRFHSGSDIVKLLSLIARSYKEYGSVFNHFMCGFSRSDENIESALIFFLNDWKSWSVSFQSRAFNHFLSSPQDKSACKRWCLFLKWMIRKDEIDLGTWTKMSQSAQPMISPPMPSQLVMPVDTHVHNAAIRLKLTTRKIPDWKMAVEVTKNLKKFEKLDPLKFDFSITRAGMLSSKTNET